MKTHSTCLRLCGMGWVLALLAAMNAAQQLQWEIEGPDPVNGNGLFPGTFDAGKDINGDGNPDVLAGAGDANGQGLGAALVYSGVDGAQLHALFNAEPGGAFGYYTYLLGDRNGDGLSEFAASIGVWSVAPGIYIYSGADAEQIDYIAPPFAYTTGFAYFLDELDANGDGVVDFLVGDASTYLNGTLPLAGSVGVLSGLDFSLIWEVQGTQAFEDLGWSGAAVGDVDGDGIEDVLVGAPGFFDPNDVTGEINASHADLLSGADGALIHRFDGNSATVNNTRFGWSVGGGGDVDGDGVDDFIIGRSITSSTKVEVYSGADFSLIHKTNNGDGVCARIVGDVDGDGYDDFLGTETTINNCIGRVQSGCGAVFVYSGKDKSLIYMIRRVGALNFGHYVVRTDAINADGFPAILIGDNRYPIGTNPQTGRISNYSLRPLGVEVFGQSCPTSSGSQPRIALGAPVEIGESTTLNLSRVDPGLTVCLYLGFSNTVWQGVALPLDLTFLNLPGCELLVSPDMLSVATTQAVGDEGVAGVTIPVPRDTTLTDTHIFAQWVVIHPPGSSPFASLSGALDMTIQNSPDSIDPQ